MSSMHFLLAPIIALNVLLMAFSKAVGAVMMLLSLIVRCMIICMAVLLDAS